MKDWPIFSGADGFGGNGPWIPELPPYIWLAVPVRSGGGCVPDGPFTIDKFSLSLGPSHNTSLSNPHCLTRDFSPEIATYNLNKATWDAVLEQSDYGRFGKRLEAGKYSQYPLFLPALTLP